MTQLDLRGTPCPLNFIRTKLALEKLSAGEWLPVPLRMPGLWRHGRTVVCCSQLSGLHGCEC